MITGLRVQHFKCFHDERLELRPLTVIVGANGVGKSSLLQSLLLAQQALETPADHARLNGPFLLDLGTTTDVLCQTSEARAGVDIELTQGDGKAHLFQLEERKKEPFILHNARAMRERDVSVTHLLVAGQEVPLGGKGEGLFAHLRRRARSRTPTVMRPGRTGSARHSWRITRETRASRSSSSRWWLSVLHLPRESAARAAAYSPRGGGFGSPAAGGLAGGGEAWASAFFRRVCRPFSAIWPL